MPGFQLTVAVREKCAGLLQYKVFDVVGLLEKFVGEEVGSGEAPEKRKRKCRPSVTSVGNIQYHVPVRTCFQTLLPLPTHSAVAG